MRHGLPLTNMESESRLPVDKQRTFSLIPSKKTDAARKTLTPISEVSRKSFSDILLGLMATLERLFECSSRRQQAYCRELWNPEHQYSPEKESQLVGFEYFGINRRIPHLIEHANICIHLECKPQSPAEAWTLESSPDIGVRVVPRSRSISACQIWVNGAELRHEDLPKFYTWLRRREYFWRGFEENQTSHQEITDFLMRFKKSAKFDQRLAALCWEFGLIKNGKPTVAGLSLLNSGKKP